MSTRTRGAFGMVLAGAVTFSVCTALLVDQSPKELMERGASALAGKPQKTDVVSAAEKTEIDETSETNKEKEGTTKLSSNPSVLQKASANKNNEDLAAVLVDEGTKDVSKKRAEKSVTSNEAETAEPPAATKPGTSVKSSRPAAVSAETKSTTASAAPKPASPKPSAPKQTATKPAAPVKPETSTKATVTRTASATTTKTDRPAASPSVPEKPVQAAPAATKPAASPKAPAAAAASAAKESEQANSAAKPANRGQEVSQAAKEKAESRKDQKENNGIKL